MKKGIKGKIVRFLLLLPRHGQKMYAKYPDSELRPYFSMVEKDYYEISITLRVQTGPSLVAQLVKNPPAVEETWVRSLGWEDPLEKGKATQSSILAWRIPWTL